MNTLKAFKKKLMCVELVPKIFFKVQNFFQSVLPHSLYHQTCVHIDTLLGHLVSKVLYLMYKGIENSNK